VAAKEGITDSGYRVVTNVGEVVGQLRLDDAALDEVAPEPEENGLGSRRRSLRAPLPLDAEEARDEPADRARGVHEEARAGERIERSRVAAIGGQALVERGVLAGELLQERAIQIRQPALVVKVLVGEAGRAERKISLGSGWRRIGGVQGTGILSRSRDVAAASAAVSRVHDSTRGAARFRESC